MTSVFATAGQTTDRRRRLIATETSGRDTELLREFGVYPEIPSPATTPIEQLGDHLIGRIISPRLWKHTAIITIVLVSTLTIAGLSMRAGHATLASDALHVVRAAFPAFTAILLLLSGQLALLIGWLRSHSTIDFDGRYRAWYWLSGFLFLLTGLFAIGSPAALVTLAAVVAQPAAGQLQAARPAVLYVPLLAFACVVGWRLIPDMRRNRVSQLLVIAAVVVTTGCLMTLSARMQISPFAQLHSVGALVAAALLFCGCLLHCRFVAHVNNDPPLRQINVSRKPAPPKTETAAAAEVGHSTAADCSSAALNGKPMLPPADTEHTGIELLDNQAVRNRSKHNSAGQVARCDTMPRTELPAHQNATTAGPVAAISDITGGTATVRAAQNLQAASEGESSAKPQSRKQSPRSGKAARNRKAG